MKSGVKVHVASWEVREDAWRTHEQTLRRLYQMSSKKHILVERPESADVILIGNVRNEILIGNHTGHERGRTFRGLMDRANKYVSC
jgi:hypothetical protein